MTPTTSDAEVKLNDERIRYWPELSYWYHLSFTELAKMPNNVRAVYIRALPRIRASVKQMYIDAASVPYMEEGDQRSLREQLKNDLNAGLPVQAPDEGYVYDTPQEGLAAAQAAGIGITVVDADGNEVQPEVQPRQPEGGEG